ncbi:MAG: methyl-accepting chemotaxis protein, partial [Leptospiraceae bacterium]|nr:methyl-accepting chemotaxis protein [Leptospiraceae bacterium]
LIIQTDSYTKNDVVRGMNPFLVMDYLKDLHNDKEEFVKSYFVSDMNGDTVNSQGFRFNVKKGKIFQSILKTEKFAISNPVKSLDDGTWILVSAVPVKYRKKLIGNFGMTFAIETLGEALKNASDNGKYDFIMISDDGRVVYNQNYKYLNLEFKKELANSKEYFGLEDLPTRDLTGFNKFNREFIDIVFEGKKMYGMLIDMPKFNSKLFMFIPKKVFYKDLNSTLLKISGFIIFITGAVIFVIRYISNNLAGPIKNTIVAFEKISNGDLTVESNDYVPDEFGEIIRYLGNLIIVLRNTVALIQSSSKELENTSEDLTNTTQTMARNSQEQAHSLQSSEDLVINLSNSVEEVADLSKNAHQSSKNTFSSMEELKDRVREVKEITIEAKDLTKSTSDEANRGNELMKDAIFGMQRISTSTKKISETIGLIGDISKQVNLLALNAAIEAARAGEFGQGFTVVAEEIGKLAEKTSRSAKNIKEYIQEGILEVDRGKNYVDNTAKALSNIITSIQKNTFLINKITDSAIVQAEFSEKVLIAVKNVMEMAERISSTTEDQTSSNQELTQSMSMISDLTSSLAKGAEDIALTSIKISEQSRTLNRMIEFFKI